MAVIRAVWRYSLLTLLFLLVLTPVVAAQPVVETLSVNVNSTAPPPPKALKRMEASISTVGQHILLGRTIAEVAANHSAYEKVIKEVFERVLVGYSVQSVSVFADQETEIRVNLEPWGATVKEVRLDVEFTGLSPEMAALAGQELVSVPERLQENLVGLPIDAVDWAASLVKESLRDLVADRLPEFRPIFEVIPGPVTTVKMTLSPVGEIVQFTEVAIRSHTLPSLLLYDAKEPLEEMAKEIRGLPISFVQRQRDYFKQKMLARVQALPMTQRYGLTYRLVLSAANVTTFVLLPETTKYRFFAEGYLDTGRKQNNTSARIHVGKWVNPRNELFVESNVVTGSMSWDFSPGYAYRFSKQTLGGFKYSLNDHETRLFIEQELGKGYMLRLERVPLRNYNEFALRYKIHDFLSAEYVVTSDEHYLRLVGNL
ncbi:MAG: hypothetical protein E6713_02560 [Sporomusaceae bacterium]|nr:hypothetical protein [Sporomusaceae bacterium]